MDGTASQAVDTQCFRQPAHQFIGWHIVVVELCHSIAIGHAAVLNGIVGGTGFRYDHCLVGEGGHDDGIEALHQGTQNGICSPWYMAKSGERRVDQYWAGGGDIQLAQGKDQLAEIVHDSY